MSARSKYAVHSLAARKLRVKLYSSGKRADCPPLTFSLLTYHSLLFIYDTRFNSLIGMTSKLFGRSNAVAVSVKYAMTLRYFSSIAISEKKCPLVSFVDFKKNIFLRSLQQNSGQNIIANINCCD